MIMGLGEAQNIFDQLFDSVLKDPSKAYKYKIGNGEIVYTKDGYDLRLGGENYVCKSVISSQEDYSQNFRQFVEAYKYMNSGATDLSQFAPIANQKMMEEMKEYIKANAMKVIPKKPKPKIEDLNKELDEGIDAAIQALGGNPTQYDISTIEKMLADPRGEKFNKPMDIKAPLKKSAPEAEETPEAEAEEETVVPTVLNESICIEVLKSKGYKVLKGIERFTVVFKNDQGQLSFSEKKYKDLDEFKEETGLTGSTLIPDDSETEFVEV